MCGIGVVIGAEGERVEPLLERLTVLLSHRGPDDVGVRTLAAPGGRQIGLCHRRLSIIDLSSAGHQPMADEYGNVLVFNGEIYNFQELRASLQQRGEVFHSASDSEVLLRAYRHFPVDVLLNQLRGMFAFALWDACRKQLLLARDPMGIKPLYFSTHPGRFACASEAKALVGAGLADASLDPAGLDTFLSYGSVVAPLSIYREVRSLMPGSYLWVEADGTVTAPHRYWHWDAIPQDVDPEERTHVLQRAVERHLVADVPVAIFLSGGFDSTAMLATAATVQADPIETFTVSFPDAAMWSEGRQAMQIAEHFHARHHDIPITLEEAMEQLPPYFTAMDQPSVDGLNIFLISRAVRASGIKACFHGVGGDELFGGYAAFCDVPRALCFRRCPAWVRRIGARFFRGDIPSQWKRAEALRHPHSLLDLYLLRRRLFRYEERAALLAQPPPLGPSGLPAEWLTYAHSLVDSSRNTFDALSRLELALYAGNTLLPDGDVMSMVHGLEVRLPLLDLDLIRTMLGTSPEAKRRRCGGWPKPALVAAVPDFPVQFMSKQKRGFALPFDQWLRRDLKPRAESLLFGAEADRIFSSEAAQRIWNRFARTQGTADWLRTWALYAATSWYGQRAIH
ncbi:MAG: asparagine synthase (glutamine-hydrolyzing) [Deltaproteobacteria bacterium]|nr:asparagine synthase (glutamine-hydrolyzing) [Deltaproteobacteria bacterium]